MKRRNPKPGLVPLGKIAKLGKDEPEACRIFKKEVLSVFSFCMRVHFMGLMTDLSSSNVCIINGHMCLTLTAVVGVF